MLYNDRITQVVKDLQYCESRANLYRVNHGFVQVHSEYLQGQSTCVMETNLVLCLCKNQRKMQS